MALTWLHLSDVHIRANDSYDRDVVLRALVKSVRRFRENGCSPDVVFATGDIGSSGKLGEYEVATAFLDELLDAAGLERRDLFVIPGNHDVDRDRGVGLARSLASREEADAYFGPDSPRPHLTQKQGAFLAWYEEFFAGIRGCPESSCGPVELVGAGGLRLGILPINSALFCQNDDDHAKLWVGRRSLDAAITDLGELPADLRIALIHHPLDWLADLERSNVRATLARNVVDPSVFPDRPNHTGRVRLPEHDGADVDVGRGAVVAPLRPRPTTVPFRSNVPSRRGLPLVGRDEELGEMAKRLGEPAGEQVLVVSGAPGVGKSELAREFARLHGDRYPGGTFFIDASSADALVDLVRVGVNFLGMEFPGDLALEDQCQQALVALGAAPTLLVYDNVQSFDVIER